MNEQNQSPEGPLWETLQAAAGMPEQVNLAALLAQVDAEIAKLPEPARLQLAGEALLRVSEIHARRSQVLITEWEEAYRDPIVETGFFAELVRQTMAVDLSELMESKPVRKPRTRRAKPTEAEVGSISVSVDKAAVLAMVEQLEAEAAGEGARQLQVLAIAEDENVSRWVVAIEQVLAKRADAQKSFSELCQCLGMLWVEVWLGVLLGGFELEQAGKLSVCDLGEASSVNSKACSRLANLANFLFLCNFQTQSPQVTQEQNSCFVTLPSCSRRRYICRNRPKA